MALLLLVKLFGASLKLGLKFLQDLNIFISQSFHSTSAKRLDICWSGLSLGISSAQQCVYPVVGIVHVCFMRLDVPLQNRCHLGTLQRVCPHSSHACRRSVARFACATTLPAKYDRGPALRV